MTEEDEIYEAFDQANKVKFGIMTGEKIISAVKERNIEEVRRLMSLTSDEGGLILLRLIQKDKNGKTALQIAEEMEDKDMIAMLRGT